MAIPDEFKKQAGVTGYKGVGAPGWAPDFIDIPKLTDERKNTCRYRGVGINGQQHCYLHSCGATSRHFPGKNT